MSLFQRAHDIVQAKANKALDAAEKPDEMLDLSYEQMLDQITRVRQGLVSVAASRKQLELQETQLQHSVDHLNEQAKAALGQGREDLAREALSRKAAAQAQIDAMEPQRQELAQQEQKLSQTLEALQKRVNNFRTQKEVLKAQYTAAQAQTPPVSAATAPAVPNTLKVSLAGLDLSTAEGVHAAQERVRLAARRVCAKVANSADMQRQLDYITCVDEAMAPVVAQIGEMARQASGQRLADAAK